MQTLKIFYDKSMQAILIDGKNVVDLSSVENGATAILYSRVAGEGEEFQSTFRFEVDEYRPFWLDFSYLSPAALIIVIVENRLQLDGLTYSPEINKVYGLVKNLIKME